MTHSIIDSSDVESPNGIFKPMGRTLGVSAFGINQIELPPGGEGPMHDHAADGQEEVYVIVRGDGTIRLDGTEERLEPGKYVFVSPDQKRQMVAGDEGLAWVGVGCKPGAYGPEG